MLKLAHVRTYVQPNQCLKSLGKKYFSLLFFVTTYIKFFHTKLDTNENIM